jgi:hypothetical protein
VFESLGVEQLSLTVLFIMRWGCGHYSDEEREELRKDLLLKLAKGRQSQLDSWKALLEGNMTPNQKMYTDKQLELLAQGEDEQDASWRAYIDDNMSEEQKKFIDHHLNCFARGLLNPNLVRGGTKSRDTQAASWKAYQEGNMDPKQKKFIDKQLDCLYRGHTTQADSWTAFENECMSEDQQTFIAGRLKHLRDNAKKISDDRKKRHTKWLDKAIGNGSLKLVRGNFFMNGANFDQELFRTTLATCGSHYNGFLVQAYERFGIDVSAYVSKNAKSLRRMGFLKFFIQSSIQEGRLQMSDEGLILFTEPGGSNSREFNQRIAENQGIFSSEYLELTKLIYKRFGHTDVDSFTNGNDLKRHVHFQTVIKTAIREQRMHLSSEGSVMLTNNDKTAPVRAAKFVFLKKCGVRVMTHSRFDVDILHFWRCAYKQLGITSDLSGCASLESLESDVMREFGLRGINEEKVTVEVVQGNVVSFSFDLFYISTSCSQCRTY